MSTAEADRAASAGIRLPVWQPWAAVALFALLLHFAWEMLQFPLFAGMSAAPHGTATRACLIATLGDGAISLFAYAGASGAARTATWVIRPRAPTVCAFFALGFAMAIAAEVANVRLLARWSYGPAMPTLLGIGLTPILQWTVVPPLILWLARAHVAGRITLTRREFGK
jgi:hypothetical protein